VTLRIHDVPCEEIMSTITPSRFDALGDESFEMPVPGLLADVDSGSATVGMTDDFYEISPAIRARIVQQWIRDFSVLRDAAIVEMFRASASVRRGTTIVQQVDEFREECQREGVRCPTDLPVLLQRY